MRKLCVYCGSSPGRLPEYLTASRALAHALHERGISLVYGGASVGLMGGLADTLLALGGEVIGVMPQALVDKEVSHSGLTELRVVASMHERKSLMAELSDGFIALPGGYGTLEELFEVVTWTQLGYHNKPCALLNIEGYFDHLLRFLDHTVEERFVKPIHGEMVLVNSNPAALLDAMASYEPPATDKWMKPYESSES
ncbi:MAG: hypothetical protein ACI9GW_001020 [Halieaceae bacterium]|jgi:uncharacterized protein (TIGR00730 family)